MNEFPVATAASGRFSIALGPDGNVWFTEVNSNKIGRITPSGVATEFPTAAGSRRISPASPTAEAPPAL